MSSTEARPATSLSASGFCLWAVATAKTVGFDIKTAQYGWPLGMPLIRKLEPGLWEARSNMQGGIARVLFTVESDVMILLHGFVKKSQKTPTTDLKIARQRLADLHKR